jgi:hypothetical protein
MNTALYFWDAFLPGFFANLCSGSIIALLFVGLAAYLIGKRLGRIKRIEH